MDMNRLIPKFGPNSLFLKTFIQMFTMNKWIYWLKVGLHFFLKNAQKYQCSFFYTHTKMLPHRHFFATSNKTERRLSDILKGGKMNLNRQCGQQVMTEDASLKASAQHDTWSVYLRETRLTEEREKIAKLVG